MLARSRSRLTDNKDRAWLAWHTARLGQIDPEKFPTLEKFTTPAATTGPGAAPATSWQNQLSAAIAWNQRVNSAKG